MATLGELIKSKGYTQKFIHSKLGDMGAKVDYTHFNRWCKDFYAPRYDFIYNGLGELLSESAETIRGCFAKNREESNLKTENNE